MAEPVIPGFEGVRREHRFLDLTARCLVLLEDPQRVAQFRVGPLQALIGFNEVPLQLTVVHAALNGTLHQTGFFGGVHKKTGGT